MKFAEIPKLIRNKYSINVGWGYLETWLTTHGQGGVDLNPDFQRPHVWDCPKRVKYIEYCLSGGPSSRHLWWNCHDWDGENILPLVIVDGKQRMEAVRQFMKNKLPIFKSAKNPAGSLFEDFTDKLDLTEACFVMNVNNLKLRSEVLTWYLQLNAGGVMHTEDELSRVRDLLRKEKRKNYAP